MGVTRRRFLKLAAGAASVAAVVPILDRTGAIPVPPSTLKTNVSAEPTVEKVVHGVCAPNCWSGCKLLVHVRDGLLVKTEMGPLPDSRYNRVCLRGLTHVERVYHPDRLKYPMKRAGERGEGKWVRISWEEAVNTIATKFTEARDKYGAQAVAFLPQSGYYGYLNGFYGSIMRFANIFGATYGSGAIDSAVPLGVQEALGGPYEGQGNEAADLVNARLILAWGSNLTESNLQNWHFVADALDNGGKLVVIDPNFTITASKADQWVPLRAGSDAALALSMINVIIEEGLYDKDFVQTRTVGPFLVRADTGLFLREKDVLHNDSDRYMVWDSDANQAVPSELAGGSVSLKGSYEVAGIGCSPAFQMLQDHAMQYTPETTSQITDVQPDTVRMIAREYATRKPATIYWGFGTDRYYHGDIIGRLVATLAALTGNIGKPGATPCGGFGGATLVSSPVNWGWLTPTKSRANSLNNLVVFDAIEKGQPYPIKAAYISNCNYAVTYPNQNKILNELFPKLDFIVAADFSMTDTAEHADIVLPVTTWFESQDLVPSMHVHIMLQEGAIDPLYECKSDLQIFSMLADKLGFGEYFNKTPEDYVRELLDTPRLHELGVTYESLKRDGAFRAAPSPYIPYRDGKFATKSGRIEFYNENLTSRSGQPAETSSDRLPAFHPPIEAWPDNPSAKKYPLVLNQAGSRFRVHTQFFNTPWLREVDPSPMVEMNPADADARRITEGDVVEVFNDRGSVRLKAKLSEGIRPGMVNISRGWARTQFIAGSSQSLIADYKNPRTLNCAFFDTLVEVKRV
jgi:anaerobic dimethyl sulfoxide reductase subunit A